MTPTLVIDPRRRAVFVGEQELRLTPQEYRVLHYLGQRAGEVISKQELLTAMWAADERAQACLEPVDQTAVDLVIFRLRKKLQDNAQSPTYVETRRGFGYLLHHARLCQPAAGEAENAPSTDLLPEGTEQKAVTDQLSHDIAVVGALPYNEPWSQLTRREWEIFLLLGDEEATRLTNRALAQQLKMAEGTFKKHLQNIYRKLDVTNRSAAALLAMRVRVALFPK